MFPSICLVTTITVIKKFHIFFFNLAIEAHTLVYLSLDSFGQIKPKQILEYLSAEKYTLV